MSDTNTPVPPQPQAPPVPAPAPVPGHVPTPAPAPAPMPGPYDHADHGHGHGSAWSFDTRWADLAFKVLSTLVVPLFLVGVSLYTEVSVQRERLIQLQTRADQTQAQIHAVNVRLDVITATLQDTNGQTRELRAVLSIVRERVENFSRQRE